MQSVPLTEKAALADLVEWSEKRLAWQKDALRRLVTGETIDDQVIAELTQVCLDPSLAHVPISQSHVVTEARGRTDFAYFYKEPNRHHAAAVIAGGPHRPFIRARMPSKTDFGKLASAFWNTA